MHSTDAEQRADSGGQVTCTGAWTLELKQNSLRLLCALEHVFYSLRALFYTRTMWQSLHHPQDYGKGSVVWERTHARAWHQGALTL